MGSNVARALEDQDRVIQALRAARPELAPAEQSKLLVRTMLEMVKDAQENETQETPPPADDVG